MNLPYNWLRASGSLQPNWSRKVTDHLKGCPACRKFVNSLLKMEKAWRDQPLPASCETSKAVFLNQLAMQKKSAPPRPTVRSWRPARWVAAAAVLLVGVGILAWAVLSPAEIRASEVVDRLVDLNTDLSKADYGKRKQLLDANEETLRKRLHADRLSEEERASGEHLLDGARKLAVSDDLEEDEEIVTELAEKLHDRAKVAKSSGNDKESEHAARYTNLSKRLSIRCIKMCIIDRLIELNMATLIQRRAKAIRGKEELRNDREANCLGRPGDGREALRSESASRRTPIFPCGRRQSRRWRIIAQTCRSCRENGKKKERSRPSATACSSSAANPFFDKMKSMQPKGPPDLKKGGFDMSKFQKQFEDNRLRGPQFNRPDMHNRFEGLTKKGFGWPPMKGGGKK